MMNIMIWRTTAMWNMLMQKMTIAMAMRTGQFQDQQYDHRSGKIITNPGKHLNAAVQVQRRRRQEKSRSLRRWWRFVFFLLAVVWLKLCYGVIKVMIVKILITNIKMVILKIKITPSSMYWMYSAAPSSLPLPSMSPVLWLRRIAACKKMALMMKHLQKVQQVDPFGSFTNKQDGGDGGNDD